MGVNIKGIDKLNVCFYNSVIIREVNKTVLVRVLGDKASNQYKQLSLNLFDNLDGLADSQKIIYVIDSFLRNNTINGIEMDVSHVGCSGKFIKVTGTRTLYLQLSNYELLKLIIKMIKDKYDRDRYGIVNMGNNLYDISLRDKSSSYGVEFVSCDDCSTDCSLNVCPKHTSFKLMCANGEIVGFDKKFIEKFLSDKLWEVRKDAVIVEETSPIRLADGTKISDCIRSYCIVCGELNIRLNCTTFSREYIFGFCNQIVSRYNEKLLQEKGFKKKQLKMEGF